jgi:hypothetical protein
MLELATSYSLSCVPYIHYDALEQYAEDVIRDALPGALTVPGPVDVARFLEFYLGLDVVYKRMCYDRRILGMTAFSAGVVDVLDEATGRAGPMPVREGTVILDPALMLPHNKRRGRFSGMHEGVHWMIHRPAFSADNPYGAVGAYKNQYLAAKEGRVDYSRSQKERNDIERMERQADFLASALLMPKVTLRMAYRQFFAFYKERPRRLVRGVSLFDDCLIQQIPAYVADIFDVSKHAALIRLEKLSAIVDRGAIWRSA